MPRQNRKAFLYLYSFMLPAVILSAVLACKGFVPFGDKSLLIMDMSGQYVEFYNALKFGDVFFSWSKTLGTNYIGVFAYYVSSPFSLLTLLFPNEAMPLCITLITVLKIGFAGMAFAIYGTKQFQLKDNIAIVFSCAYALMGYNIAYSMCLMWLDAVLWLPIILLGIEKIITDKQWKLFVASLFMCLISNYYISYMVILFSGLYFVSRCFEERLGANAFLYRAGVYVLGGCSAAGAGAFFLLPTFLSQFDGKLVDSTMDYGSLYTFAWPDFFHKLFLGGYDSITNSGAPFVYCGFPVAVLALIFFFLPDVNWRNKLSGGVLLGFMALSMHLAPLDKIWHVFQYPNWFPYRYSFLFSFVVISLACRAASKLPTSFKGASGIVLLGWILISLVVNTDDVIKGLDSQFGYKSYAQYRQYRQEKERLLSNMNGFMDGFYRVNSVENAERTMNDALGFDYNGITHYSSSYLSSINIWLKRYGLAQNYFWSSGYGSTPLTDAFLGVKYVIADREPGMGYVKIDSEGGMSLYENPYSSSIAFWIPENSPNPINTGSVMENQNSLFCFLTGMSGELFRPLNVSEEYIDGYTRISFVSDGSPVYCHFSRRSNSAAFYVNGSLREYLFTNETDCVQYIGSFVPGEIVTLALETNIAVDGYEICSLDNALFAEGTKIMADRALEITEWDNWGRIVGNVNADAGGVLMTSIPFADGWSAYVDGEKVSINSILDTFITIPLKTGSHEVELRYTPPGLAVGGVISLLAILIILPFYVCAVIKTKSDLQE